MKVLLYIDVYVDVYAYYDGRAILSRGTGGFFTVARCKRGSVSNADCKAIILTTRYGDGGADGFARLSGMPAEYFDKLQQAFPDGDIGALRVFLALRGAARRIDTVVAKWLDAYGVTATKVDILHLVSANPRGTTAARLREHLMMTQPNVTFVVAGLEREGLIRRSADPDDKRSVLIRLTPAGKRLIAGMTGDQLKALKQSASVFNDVEKDTMIRMLSALTQSFEATTAPKVK